MSMFRRFRFQLYPELAPEIQVYPLNDTFVLQWNQENNQIFFRKDVPTKFNFAGSDFDTLLVLEQAVDQCDSIRMTIERKCSGVWTIVSDGTLIINRGEWDLDKCFCTLEYRNNDPYSDVVDNERYDYQTNILLAGSPITATMWNGTVEYNTCGPTNFGVTRDTNPANNNCSLPNLATWSVISHKISGGGGFPHFNTTVRAREIITTATPPGDGWTNIGGSDWARQVPTAVITDTFWDDGQEYFIEYEILGQDEQGNDLTFSNGRKLETVINSTWPGLSPPTIISDFFGINPLGLNPTNDAYTQALEHYQDIVIWQKSDITKSEAIQDATIGMMSFKELMDMIREKFNCYWWLDSGLLYIEHVSYLTAANGMDLTVSPFAEQILRKNRYKYDESKTIKEEKFVDMEQGFQDFVGRSILYENDCVATGDGSVTEHSTGRFTFDLEYMLAYREQISNDGFFVGACYETGGNYSFIKMTGKLSGLTLFNNSCSWANVHDPLWKWGRAFDTGLMNNTGTTFESWERRKVQDEIIIRGCCEDINIATYNPALLVNTGLGWGLPASVRFDAKTEEVQFELNHY